MTWKKSVVTIFLLATIFILPLTTPSSIVESKSRWIRQTETETEQPPPHPLDDINPLVIQIPFAIFTTYLLIAILLVCKNYFVPVLEFFITVHGIGEDVVGGVFLAGGLSIPPLVTGVFFSFATRNDIFIQGSLGFSIFNLLIILGISALFSAKEGLPLSRCPILRDGVFYGLALLGTMLAFLDDRVSWWESLTLLLLYCGYLLAMKFSARIRARVGKTPDQSPPQEMSPQEDLAVEEPLSLGWPSEGGPCSKICFILLFPINGLLYVTLPDVRSARGRRFWVWAYIGSITWITILNSHTLWFGYVASNILGRVLGIWGGSLPHLLCCVVLATKGRGDVVLGSVVGFVIFNLLLTLPLPWFLRTLIHSDLPHVSGRGALCVGVLLEGIWISLLVCLLLFRWRITRGLGVTLLGLAIIFGGVTALLDYEVLTCP